MVAGAPPVGRNNMAQGFNASPHMGAAGKQDLSEADIEAFVQAIFGVSAEPFLRDAVARADGRFRKRLFEAARTVLGSAGRLRSCSRTFPAGRRNRLCGDSHVVSCPYLWRRMS
jgi:hypothetical protein